MDITVAWIEERLRRPCPRTGEPFALLQPSRGGFNDRHPYGPSLDQIIPGQGYTTSNVQVVAWAYNCAKQQFSDHEVLELCKKIAMTASS